MFHRTLLVVLSLVVDLGFDSFELVTFFKVKLSYSLSFYFFFVQDLISIYLFKDLLRFQ